MVLLICVIRAILSPPVGRVMCTHAAHGEYMHLSKLHSWLKNVLKYNLCAINKLGFIPANSKRKPNVGLVLALALQRHWISVLCLPESRGVTWRACHRNPRATNKLLSSHWAWIDSGRDSHVRFIKNDNKRINHGKCSKL